MNKKIFFIIVFMMIFLVLSFGEIKNKDDKKIREEFYSILINKMGFNANDCIYIKSIGYTPVFSYILLYISRETKIPIKEIVKMREEYGYSWQDMCETVGLDYENIIRKAREDAIKYDINFPSGTSDELKKSTASRPKKEKGYKK